MVRQIYYVCLDPFKWTGTEGGAHHAQPFSFRAEGK